MKNKFSKRLKELREKKGLSIKELAAKTNISDVSIMLWEGNRRIIRSKHIIILSEFFEVEVDYLLV